MIGQAPHTLGPTMRDIFDLVDETHINPREPYLRAYPYLVDWQALN